MGCHTWFYKKIDVSIEEARENVINNLQQSILVNNRILNNYILKIDVLSDDDMWYVVNYPEYTSKEYLEYIIKLNTRQLRMIEKGLCKVGVMNKYDNGELTVYVDGKGMFETNDSLPHDIFRKNGYPEDKLFSYEETIDYISNIDNKCSFHMTHLETIDALFKFWKENPDGMIEFG